MEFNTESFLWAGNIKKIGAWAVFFCHGFVTNTFTVELQNIITKFSKKRSFKIIWFPFASV